MIRTCNCSFCGEEVTKRSTLSARFYSNSADISTVNRRIRAEYKSVRVCRAHIKERMITFHSGTLIVPE
jgi:hypothetical protein